MVLGGVGCGPGFGELQAGAVTKGENACFWVFTDRVVEALPPGLVGVCGTDESKSGRDSDSREKEILKVLEGIKGGESGEEAPRVFA